MRILHAEYLSDRAQPELPLLRLTIHGAPHRRTTAPGPLATVQEIRAGATILDAYRIALVFAGRQAGIFRPIEEEIDLELTFIEPTSTDMDNLYVAFCQAADGGRVGRHALLYDDSLIQKVMMQKLFPTAWEQDNPARMQLPKLVVAGAA